MARKNIFCFEDDPYILESHVQALRKKYNVEIGASIELVEKQDREPIDLVIVDLMIHSEGLNPEKDRVKQNIHYDGIPWKKVGVEFLRRIKAGDYTSCGFFKHTPIIVATGTGDFSTKVEVEKIGVSDYLEKPFTIDMLDVAVEKALKSKNGGPLHDGK